MNILVDSGDYKCSNMGDVAMLQVAVSRLRNLFPRCRVHVITSNPVRLNDLCPETNAVPHRGLQDWFADRYILGRVHDLLPQATSRKLAALKRAVRRRWPTILESLVRIRTQLRPGSGADLKVFLDSINDADLVVISGQGGLNDEFRDHAMAVLNLLEFAARLGKPTAMFGQGLGPIVEPGLVQRAKAILPNVDLIALRETRSSLPLLRSLGISFDRILTTGDDAIELAYHGRQAKLGDGIGVNMRAARHNGITEREIERLRDVIQASARKHGAALVPLPIARHPDCKDARDTRLVLNGYDDSSDGGRGIDTPLKVIGQVGRCRVVLTTAYHAAVFALAQGIPVVAVAKSAYVTDKFLGLRDLFGEGCVVLSLSSEAVAEELSSAMERAWTSAEARRPELLQAATTQLGMVEALNARLRSFVDARGAVAA